jgi:hypothetical protein
MSEQLNIRLPASVAALLSAAQSRYGAAVPRTRLVEIALGHGLRALLGNPALLFEVPAAPTEAAPAAAPTEDPPTEHPPTEHPPTEAAPAAATTEHPAPPKEPRQRKRPAARAAAPTERPAAPVAAPTEAAPFDALTPRETLEPAVYKALVVRLDALKGEGHPAPLKAVYEGAGLAKSSLAEWKNAAAAGRFNSGKLGIGKLRDLARFLGVIPAPDASPDASTP